MAASSQYAERLRTAMRQRREAQRPSVRIVDLVRATGYSREHIRKVLAGQPVASRTFNDAICAALDLDSEEMWQIAKQEKFSERLGLGLLAKMPKDIRLVEIWPVLPDTAREKVIRFAEALKFVHETERIKQQIEEAMSHPLPVAAEAKQLVPPRPRMTIVERPVTVKGSRRQRDSEE